MLLTGNVFLGIIGILAGTSAIMHMESSPDLVVMLSLTTAICAGVLFITVMPLGILLLGMSPERMCSGAQALQGRLTQPYEGAVVAEDQWQSIGYPYNMTERAQGHEVASAYSPTIVKYATQLSGVVCGPHAGTVLVAFALAVVAYAFIAVLPLMILSLRLSRAARRAGGCAACLTPMPMAVVVQVPPRVPHAPFAAAPVRPGESKVPIANAVPVTQAASVRVAPNEMH